LRGGKGRGGGWGAIGRKKKRARGSNCDGGNTGVNNSVCGKEAKTHLWGVWFEGTKRGGEGKGEKMETFFA